MPKKNKLALVDGYGFVFRAYHSLPPLTKKDGTPVGAVYGFTNMLIRLLASLDVTHLSIVFDSGSKSFRHDIYSSYKANRPPCPPDLIPQFSLIREAAEAFNLHISEKVGYEADDLIATLAKSVDKEDFEVLIISSDKDLMQLVGDNIVMFDAMKNKIIGSSQVQEKFAAPPNQVLDILALTGDSSDNIPGVKGIGPKTAAELIAEYGSLENLLNNLDNIKQEKRREMLKNGKENALLSKKLLTLCTDAAINTNMKDFEVKNIEPQKLLNFLEEQEFRSLAARVRKEFHITESIHSHSDTHYVSSTKQTNFLANFSEIKQIIASNLSEVKNFKEHALKSRILLLDAEFDPNDKTHICSLTLLAGSLTKPENLIHINFSQDASTNTSGDSDLFSKNHTSTLLKNSLNSKEVLEELSTLFTSSFLIKAGYKIKEIVKFLISNSSNKPKIIITEAADDLALLAYLLDSGSSGPGNNHLSLNNLAKTYLNSDWGKEISNPEEFEEALLSLEKGQIPELFKEPLKKANFYFFKLYLVSLLYNPLKHKIFQNKLNLVYFGLERPLLEVLANMELAGVAIDQNKLKILSGELTIKAQKIAGEIYQLAGEEFNIGSPKQLSHILFEKLSLKSGKKSKTGAYSTNSEILEELDEEGQVIAGKILEWRHFSKLKSTYADALPAQINPKTGRIHTTFSNLATSTGRLSSFNPNLQNIPIRSEEGMQIRQTFISAPGYKLLSADYSQIELRVLAHIADIANLKQAFRQDKDIHKITASQIFGVPEDQIDSNLRRKAKAINFGIIYGISAFGLAKQLKITNSDASNYIKAYFATYPGIQDYMTKYQELGRKQGYVTTLTGRKCFVPDINSKNPTLRGIAERLAINAPIQGSAADIIKKAMIDLTEELKSRQSKSKLILQVHDELILEVPEEEVEVTKNLLKQIMEKAFLLDLPLKVDVEISNRWHG